jgi:heat shock protein HslJ
MADQLHSLRLVMNSSRCVFFLIVVASLAIGCAESSSTPTSPSSVGGSLNLTADQLAGTWSLVSIQPAGQADQATPPGASYRLTFADGRLSTQVDCNVCSGAFTLSRQTLTAGPALACTRAACPTMAFENVYTNLLGGDSTVTLSDGTLVLSSARGVLRFTR